MFKDYDQKVSQNDLYALIREWEHGEQDFKYRISDARKIARTLSAFANTTGGRLLVGVRDNGSIAGVKDEDDIYMLESASEIFLKPALKLEVWAHEIEGKNVWEIEVAEGKEKPYQVDEIDGLKAYYRDNDQNFVANALSVLAILRASEIRYLKSCSLCSPSRMRAYKSFCETFWS